MLAKARGAKSKPRRKRGSTGKARAATSVYFLSMSVENVRCFGPKQTLDLSDGKGNPVRWTVILGNNGVGKTTLLQCFISLETREPHVRRGHPTSYYPKGRWPVQAYEMSDVRRGAHHASMGAEVLIGGALGKDTKGESKKLNVRWLPPAMQGYGYQWTDSSAGVACYGYGATRRMGAGALSAPIDSSTSGSLFREDVPLRNAEEWLLQADYGASKRSSGQKQAKARRDRTIRVLKDILPDITDIRFIPPTKKDPAARVEFKTPYGWVGMQQLSLGYRTLIAWMVDLASRLFERYPDSANPLAEPAIVLVDEIDLHLHPKWQRRLMGYLSEHFPATQFIVTAHSPLVVQSAADANIVVLRPEGDHVVIDNDVASIRGWRVDQILTSDLFGLKSARPPQLDALLEERTALLSKPRLTSKDEARLRGLEAAIGPLPTGETATEREAMEIIQRFAERIRKDAK